MKFLQKQLQDFWRDITSIGSTLLYFIITLPFFAADKTSIALQLITGYFLIYLVAGAIKLVYFKNRPAKENYTNFAEKIDASAFPSIHSARTIFMALTLGKMFDTTIITAFFLAVTALVCYSRIAIKKHYWSDVIGGIVLGLLTFLIINKLF